MNTKNKGQMVKKAVKGTPKTSALDRMKAVRSRVMGAKGY